MPKIDEDAKRWQEATAARIGKTVQARRIDLRMSVPQLAERTRELGYPIHRVAIGKIESGNRLGKLDTSELLILAKALDIPALWLFFPDLVDTPIEALPGVFTPSGEAALEFCGYLDDDGDMKTLYRLHDAREQFEVEGTSKDEMLRDNARQTLAMAKRLARKQGWVVDD
ncbi:helix-turn-helix domain-containing protein [Mycobacterium marinum]|uniref:helix-turn-helix domain-containing protein n=1 Tax=Mycobacterium marinum TaxID=1781 RepID=UPI00114030B0|nr:helix-turn-helix transcriptional regulator [Mycobacterium marinum]